MEKNNKTIVVVSMFVIVFAVVFLLYKMLSNSFIFIDDTDTSFSCGFLDIFKNPSNGIIPSGILDNIFGSYLPFKLGIHPGVFKGTYFAFIEAVIIVGIVAIWTKVLYGKFDVLFPFAFLFTLVLFFAVLTVQPNMLFVYDGFFRMLFSAFWWVLFFITFRKFLEGKEQKYIIFTSILVFCNCIAGELNCAITIIGLGLYCILSLLKRKADLKIILYFIVPVLSGILVGAYTGMFVRKIDLFQNLLSIIPLSKEFLLDYFKYIILNYGILYSLLIFQFIYIRRNIKSDSAKEVINFSICSIVGLLCFFASLILMGKTHYEGGFWLVHEDLHVIYLIILCTLNFAMFNIIENAGMIKAKTMLKVFILFIFIFSPIVFHYFYNYTKNVIKPIKKQTYIAEKIIRIQNCANKTAYLDKELLKNRYYWALYGDLEETKENTLYKSSTYIDYLNQFENENKITNGFIFTDREKIWNAFNSNGGNFSDEELEQLDFGLLYRICK